MHFNDANTITRGFSGAPLIVNEQYLIGVVQIIFNEDEHQRGHDIAEAIPADILKEHFPAQYDDTYRYYLDQPTFRDLKRGSNRTNSLSHFRFTEQKTAFAWPTGVKEALHDFCHSSASFSWWLITGGAGTGKSRTALELCEILKKEGWIAGFLASKEGKPPDFWETWVPMRDTLLVVDYAAQQFKDEKTSPAEENAPPDIADILRRLADRAKENTLGGYKVRLLLLEREYKERGDTGSAG